MSPLRDITTFRADFGSSSSQPIVTVLCVEGDYHDFVDLIPQQNMTLSCTISEIDDVPIHYEHEKDNTDISLDIDLPNEVDVWNSYDVQSKSAVESNIYSPIWRMYNYCSFQYPLWLNKIIFSDMKEVSLDLCCEAWKNCRSRVIFCLVSFYIVPFPSFAMLFYLVLLVRRQLAFPTLLPSINIS